MNEDTRRILKGMEESIDKLISHYENEVKATRKLTNDLKNVVGGCLDKPARPKYIDKATTPSP